MNCMFDGVVILEVEIRRYSLRLGLKAGYFPLDCALHSSNVCLFLASGSVSSTEAADSDIPEDKLIRGQ